MNILSFTNIAEKLQKITKKLTWYICQCSDLEVSALSQEFSYEVENELSFLPTKKYSANNE